MNNQMRRYFGIMLIWLIFFVALWGAKEVYAFNNNSGDFFGSTTASSYAKIFERVTPEPAPEVHEDIYYLDYRNNSWDIPDEIVRTNEFWIEVDLTQQMLYAYRGGQLIEGFLISSGTRDFKTVTGIYKIYAKYPSVDMRGPGYDLADVPYTMFFHKGYAIHGTYWHNFFGRQMSRGCVNMVTEEAAWIYENAPVGTYVIVHY